MLLISMIACFAKKNDIPDPQQQLLQQTTVGDEVIEQGVDLNNDGQTDFSTNLEPGMIVEKLDINSDGKVDVTNHYKMRDDGSKTLVYKSVDLNWDGNVDVHTWFNLQGEIEREAIDGDFDGLTEWVDYYKGNKLVRSEVDSDFDGKSDLFRIYKSQRLEEKRYDSNGDGKIDFWQYYDAEGNLKKTGRDLDGDGEVDTRN